MNLSVLDMLQVFAGYKQAAGVSAAFEHNSAFYFRAPSPQERVLEILSAEQLLLSVRALYFCSGFFPARQALQFCFSILEIQLA